MKVGDEILLNGEVAKVTRKVYDQSLKKTVFYAGETKLTGDEKAVEPTNPIIEKLEAVESAIKAIPKVEIPEYPTFPAFPEPKEFPAFPEFPNSMTVNVPDLSSIEKKLDSIIVKEDNETKELIKKTLEELKKTKSDAGVVSAIQRLAGIIPKSEDYTSLLKEISEKLNPITQEEVKINKEQWRQLTKALSSMGGPGGGPGAVQLRSESGTILNPATQEKQDAIVTAIENITIPAPAGGATEAKQDAIITALGNVKIDTGDIDLNTDGLETIGATTNTKLDTQIVNQETLISLIETLQETNHRLSFLAGMANAGAPALRTIPIASVSTAVTGSVTATVASTVVSSLTNFGTGIPASEMAHDMNNQTAILANINNASA